MSHKEVVQASVPIICNPGRTKPGFTSCLAFHVDQISIARFEEL